MARANPTFLSAPPCNVFLLLLIFTEVLFCGGAWRGCWRCRRRWRRGRWRCCCSSHGCGICGRFRRFVDLNDVANLAAEWRSGKTAEDQTQRMVRGSLADVETTDAVEGDDACVRRVAADFQRAAMHVRQGIAHHAVRVLGASGHVGQSSESGDEKHAEYSRRPFPETIQWKLFSVYLAACGKNSIIRGRLSSAACPALFCSAPAHSR